jgi:hypothetical protein
MERPALPGVRPEVILAKCTRRWECMTQPSEFPAG